MLLWKKASLKIVCLSSIFFWYAFVVLVLIVLPFPLDRAIFQHAGEAQTNSNNFVPFASLAWTFTKRPFAIWREVAGNIVLFVPLGVLFPMIWKKTDEFLKMLAIGAGISLALECIQLAISTILGFTYRVFDIDDVLLNAAGCMLGYVLLRVGKTMVEKSRSTNAGV